MEFICLQVKLWDTDSAGVFGGVWGWRIRALRLWKRERRTDMGGLRRRKRITGRR